jgi:hypothetical protein
MLASSTQDFDRLVREGLIKIIQFPELADYPAGAKKGLEEIASLLSTTEQGQLSQEKNAAGGRRRNSKITLFGLQDKQARIQVITDRTVLKCLHRVELARDIEANMALERRHHINFKMFAESSLLVTYPVKDMLSLAKGKGGIRSKWMELLIRKYDSVIFAFSVKEGGVALNLA